MANRKDFFQVRSPVEISSETQTDSSKISKRKLRSRNRPTKSQRQERKEEKKMSPLLPNKSSQPDILLCLFHSEIKPRPLIRPLIRRSVPKQAVEDKSTKKYQLRLSELIKQQDKKGNAGLRTLKQTQTNLQQTKSKLKVLEKKFAKRLVKEKEVEEDDADKMEIMKISVDIEHLSKLQDGQCQELKEICKKLQNLMKDTCDPLFWNYGPGKMDGGFYCAEEANMIYSHQFAKSDFGPKWLIPYKQTNLDAQKLIGKLMLL